jgi:hypothetical protein
MNEKIVQEVLHELFSALETLDTQSTAILQFLKGNGIATEADLAPYLEQAGNASSVRWRAVRVRTDYLLSSAMQSGEHEDKDKKESPKAQESREESKDRRTGTSRSKETEKGAQAARPVGSGKETGASEVQADSEKNQKPQDDNAAAKVDANSNKDKSKVKADSDGPAGKADGETKTEENAA